MQNPENPYQMAYESLIGNDQNDVNDPIWEIVGKISELNQALINEKITILTELKVIKIKEAEEKEKNYQDSLQTNLEIEDLHALRADRNKSFASVYRIDQSLGNLQKRLAELHTSESQLEKQSVMPKSAIPPNMRSRFELGGARKGSQPAPSTVFTGVKTATGNVIPSSPPPVPPVVKPIDSPSPTASSEDKATAPPSFSHATYKPRAGSTPTISLGATRKGSTAVIGRSPPTQKPPSPLAAETSTPATRSGTGAPPLASSGAEQVGAKLTTTKRPVVADASSAPLKPTPLPSSQSKMIMEKINSIAEQVAAKKINAEKASEEIAQIIMQMDRDMHANLKMAKDKQFSSISTEQRKASLAPTPVLSSATNLTPSNAQKDERLLNLEQAELASYMKAYETIHFYLEFPAQQKADIDTLKYAIQGSIVACDPLMNEMLEISKRITEIERLEQIEKRENWEKKQKQNDLKKRIEDPKNADQISKLEDELANLIKNDDADYQKKLPIITNLQQEKDALNSQVLNKEKLLMQRSQAWLAGTLDKNEEKVLAEIIATKERVVNLWLKVAEILYRNHDYEGLFQVQSVLNQLYGTIERAGQKQARQTADIILESEFAAQLESYAKLGIDNTFAKNVMREHIKNHENFIPLLAITAPAFISATEMFDPLVKLVKPENNVDALGRRATNISNLGKETRAEWQKRIESSGTDETKKKELREKLLLSDSEIGKEVLKKKLEATQRTVSKVIEDTDSFESHLPRSVVMKQETLLSKAKVVELNTGEVVSGVAQGVTSVEKIDQRITSMIQLREMQMKVLGEVEKCTEKDKIIPLFELNMKIVEAIDEKLKLLGANDFGQQKKCYEEKERCINNALSQVEILKDLDRKNKNKWEGLLEDLIKKRNINKEFKSVAYDSVATSNYQKFLTTSDTTFLSKREYIALDKQASDLLAKFNDLTKIGDLENYIKMLKNIESRINSYYAFMKQHNTQSVRQEDKLKTTQFDTLDAYMTKLKCAQLALALDKELEDVAEMGKNPKSIGDITKYKDTLNSIHTNARKAEDDLKKLGTHVDPSAIAIMKKLRSLGDESQPVGDKLLTRATLTTSTISQSRTPPH